MQNPFRIGCLGFCLAVYLLVLHSLLWSFDCWWTAQQMPLRLVRIGRAKRSLQASSKRRVPAESGSDHWAEGDGMTYATESENDDDLRSFLGSNAAFVAQLHSTAAFTVPWLVYVCNVCSGPDGVGEEVLATRHDLRHLPVLHWVVLSAWPVSAGVAPCSSDVGQGICQHHKLP